MGENHRTIDLLFFFRLKRVSERRHIFMSERVPGEKLFLED